MESQTLVRNGGTTGIWRQLPGEAGLRLDRESCLPFRYRTEGCSACADACPRGAISLLPGDLAVSAECVGCGRCMAACPMGALDHPGFEPGRETVGADARPLPVECKRIPASQRAAGAMVVPCLGGIEAAWLMERQRPSGGVRLMDRGLCQGCSAGGGEVHPVSRALDHARDLLETMGIPLSHLPSLERDELPAESPAGEPVPPAGGTNLSRRAFFGRLARTAEVAVFRSPQSGEPAGGTRLARGPKSSRARWRLLAASMSLARTSGHRHCERSEAISGYGRSMAWRLPRRYWPIEALRASSWIPYPSGQGILAMTNTSEVP
ncbi:MAG: 4Fe-4S binding protein [Xanthomonadaceae bacterium]|nr:4Fe-4S binding protein [Xanthomonadaceae bacterium]